jgi:hypothetical protein
MGVALPVKVQLLERNMARELRQSHHHTGDMWLSVNKQYGETYKTQRGDHRFHSHQELPFEHPQSTRRISLKIVSKILWIAVEVGYQSFYCVIK